MSDTYIENLDIIRNNGDPLRYPFRFVEGLMYKIESKNPKMTIVGTFQNNVGVLGYTFKNVSYFDENDNFINSKETAGLTKNKLDNRSTRIWPVTFEDSQENMRMKSTIDRQVNQLRRPQNVPLSGQEPSVGQGTGGKRKTKKTKRNKKSKRRTRRRHNKK